MFADVEKWFKYFDKNNDGSLPAKKTDLLMLVVGLSVTKSEAEGMMESHGIDSK